jgi:hypothetical protein
LKPRGLRLGSLYRLHFRATIALVSSPAYAKEAAFVHDEAHLSTEDIAIATGAAPSTARAWIALTRIPTGKRARRIAELSSITERLLRVMDPEYIPVWINKPIPALDDRKPLELIARGQYRRVAQVVSALEEPVAA